MDEKYFSRTATWMSKDDVFVVHDSFSPKAPRMITMDDWPQSVFMAADGEHTVAEYVNFMESQYEEGAPPGLKCQIHDIVQELVEERLVKLHTNPMPLPKYFLLNRTEMTPDEIKSLMQADGLIG